MNHSCLPNAVVVFPRSGKTKAKEPVMNIITLRDIEAGEEVYCTPRPDFQQVLNFSLTLGVNSLHRHDPPKGAKAKCTFRNLQLCLSVPVVSSTRHCHRPTGNHFVSQVMWRRLSSTK